MRQGKGCIQATFFSHSFAVGKCWSPFQFFVSLFWSLPQSVVSMINCEAVLCPTAHFELHQCICSYGHQAAKLMSSGGIGHYLEEAKLKWLQQNENWRDPVVCFSRGANQAQCSCTINHLALCTIKHYKSIMCYQALLKHCALSSSRAALCTYQALWSTMQYQAVHAGAAGRKVTTRIRSSFIRMHGLSFWIHSSLGQTDRAHISWVLIFIFQTQARSGQVESACSVQHKSGQINCIPSQMLEVFRTMWG